MTSSLAVMKRPIAGIQIVGLSLIFSMPTLSNLRAQGMDPGASDNPPVPPSASIRPELPEKVVRVALVDSGVNYLLPSINRYLARDDQGDLIGYDFWDLDDRPFDAHPNNRGQVQRHGTKTASILFREAPFVELIPYRYPRPDMSRMQDLLFHAAQNDVRVIGLPLGGNRIDQWQVFEQAASQHPDILFIASAGNNGRDIDQRPVYPASLPLQNMLVVTSADDFVRPAQGVNWGRTSVDYMVPAEQQRITRFDGTVGYASGSSYAVPRVVALAARMIKNNPQLTVSELIANIRRRFANGASPGKIGQGYLHDPQLDSDQSIEVVETINWTVQSSHSNESGMDASQSLFLPLDVLVLHDSWAISDVTDTLDQTASILSTCDIVLSDVTIRLIAAPHYLRNLETGSAKTLMDAIRLSGPERRTTAVFAYDSRMNTPFDAEAFGRGNTRSRPWLTDSVWLTVALQDRGIALAHELFHVLSNSGQHSDEPGNLMLARTTGTNTRLSPEQCQTARHRATEMRLLFEEPVVH